MTPSDGEKDTIALMIERLLSGPARPGQAFNMPGCNYDSLLSDGPPDQGII